MKPQPNQTPIKPLPQLGCASTRCIFGRPALFEQTSGVCDCVQRARVDQPTDIYRKGGIVHLQAQVRKLAAYAVEMEAKARDLENSTEALRRELELWIDSEECL